MVFYISYATARVDLKCREQCRNMLLGHLQSVIPEFQLVSEQASCFFWMRSWEILSGVFKQGVAEEQLLMVVHGF